MKISLIARLGLVAGSFAGAAYAEGVSASPPAGAAGSTIPSNQEAKIDSKREGAVEKKDNVENQNRVEFDSARRLISAFYANASQARLKVYAVKRFDPEIAKPREYFISELSGAAIIEPLKLNADDSTAINSVIAILERFQSEAEKTSQLKANMAKRKGSLESELSREETHMVELQSAPAPDVTAIDASKAQIVKLKDNLILATEIGAMPKISGLMGVAKINMDRPAYEFWASFEPAKQLYTLSAGYSFQVDAKDVKYYVDLLKRTQEFKAQLLENEARTHKLHQEVEGIFQEKKL